MAIYSGFSHWKWWFSIAMLVHQRVWSMLNLHDWSFVWIQMGLSMLVTQWCVIMSFPHVIGHKLRGNPNFGPNQNDGHHNSSSFETHFWMVKCIYTISIYQCFFPVGTPPNHRFLAPICLFWWFILGTPISSISPIYSQVVSLLCSSSFSSWIPISGAKTNKVSRYPMIFNKYSRNICSLYSLYYNIYNFYNIYIVYIVYIELYPPSLLPEAHIFIEKSQTAASVAPPVAPVPPAGPLQRRPSLRCPPPKSTFGALWWCPNSYSYGHLPVINTYNPIYRMYNPIYNQL